MISQEKIIQMIELEKENYRKDTLVGLKCIEQLNQTQQFFIDYEIESYKDILKNINYDFFYLSTIISNTKEMILDYENKHTKILLQTCNINNETTYYFKDSEHADQFVSSFLSICSIDDLLSTSLTRNSCFVKKEDVDALLNISTKELLK